MYDSVDQDKPRPTGALLSLVPPASPEGRDDPAGRAGAPRDHERPVEDGLEGPAGGRRHTRTRPRPDEPGLGARMRARLSAWRKSRGPRRAAPPEPAPPVLEAPTAPAPPPAHPLSHPWVSRAQPDDPRWHPLIDPMTVVRAVMGSKRLIALATVLGAAIAAAVAISTPKMYYATAELLVDPRELAIVDRDLTASGLPSDATLAIVESQVRVLTSGTVLNGVVDRLDLASDPEFNGNAKSFGLSDIVAGLRSLVTRPEDGGRGAERALAVGTLAERLYVERGGKTFVISISALSSDPDKSALIANTVAEVFLQTYGQIHADTAGRASEELSARLDELREGVEAAERAVESFKEQNGIIGAQGRLISDDEMVKLNDQLAVARAHRMQLEARATSIRSVDLVTVLDGSLPEQIASPVMVELRSQYAVLKQESDRLAVRLGPRHPQRRAAEVQLVSAREQMQGELRRIVAAIQVDLQRARHLEQELAARLTELKSRQSELGADLVTLRELERDVSSKRSVYESYLLRSRETGQQQSLNMANMSVISHAYAPLSPTGPSRSTTTVMGALLGFVAGLGLAGLHGIWVGLRAGMAGQGTRPPLPPGPGPDPARPDRRFRDARREEGGRDERQPEPQGLDNVAHLRAELDAVRQMVHELAAIRAGRDTGT